MAQGQSSKIIPMIKWIPTSRLSIKNSLTARAVDSAGARCANQRLRPLDPHPPLHPLRSHGPRRAHLFFVWGGVRAVTLPHIGVPHYIGLNQVTCGLRSSQGGGNSNVW